MTPTMGTTTTDDGWKVYELMERCEPRWRINMLSSMTERVSDVLGLLGAKQATVCYLSPPTGRNSLLARAKGFWKLHPDVMSTIPQSAAMESIPDVGPDGLDHLGLATVRLTELVDLVVSVHKYPRNGGCIIVPLGERNSVRSLQGIRSVLSKARSELCIIKELTREAQHNSVVVIVPFGRFDDIESGLMLCGPASLRRSGLPFEELLS